MTSGSITYADLLDSSGTDPTDTRILDATLELFAEVGISRAGIDDIARRAKVNRATVYRRIGGKDAITRAALQRETSRFLDGIAARLREISDNRQRVIDGFAMTVSELRTHPVLRKTLTVDGEQSLSAVTLDAGPILLLATAFVTQEIIGVRPGDDGADADTVAAVIVRLVHSLVLIPAAPPYLNSDDDLRDFATRHLVPLVRPVEPTTP